MYKFENNSLKVSSLLLSTVQPVNICTETNELFLELLQRSEVLLSYDLEIFLKRPVPGVQLVKRSVVVNGVISERGVKNRERLGSGRDPAQASLVLRSVLTLQSDWQLISSYKIPSE